MNKGLTATIIVEAQSLNYDEGFGNLSVLKKLRRGSGDVFSFASRQSLRYSIVKQGVEQFGWKLSPIVKKKGAGGGEGVLQASPEAAINTYAEIDLFGYMKTDVAVGKKKDGNDGKETLVRSAVARITPAISLEPFFNDIEFLNSKWMADRSGNQPNIANIEQHRSLYKYSLTIDLDRVGTEDWNESIKNLEGILDAASWNNIKEDYLKSIEQKDKAQRITELLEVLKNLYRDIRGRREDLKPLFIIGGVYPVKNPFFMNGVKIEWENGKPKIVKEAIDELLNSKYSYKSNEELKEKEEVRTNTVIGIRNGIFANGSSFSVNIDNAVNAEEKKGTNTVSPEDAIDILKSKVNDFYGVNNGSPKG